MNLEIFEYDDESEEAKILVKTHFGDFICYAHPFSGDLRTVDPTRFDVLLTKNACISDRNSCSVTKNSGSYFAYTVCGIKIDSKSVSVNELVFRLDEPLSKDISNGEPVEFDCLRIDAVLLDEGLENAS